MLLAIAIAAVTATAWATVHMIDIGTPAPKFDLPVFGNAHRHIALDSLRGKVVMIDFWASWCGPCRQSFPLYEALRKELPAKDFTLLAINLDEMIDGPSAFLEEHPVGYASVADPEGDVAKQFGLIGMPSSFVLDRDGIVRARHTGFKPKDVDELRREITDLIKGDVHAN
jgi:thiol-disulfide isomerase/thioredoxin